jgi:branched-chain amino acid aminotransferase
MSSVTPVLWINGRLMPVGHAGLDPRDRGFTLGDGLFETLRVRDGRPWRLDAHLARLRSGAAVIDLPVPWRDDELAGAIAQTVAANALSEAAVRATISRGIPASRGLLPDPDAPPTLVIHAQQFAGYPPEIYARGMHASISHIRRNEYSPLANLKTLGYLDNVLARRDAAAQGMDEALLLNTRGQIACATAANIFVLLDGILVTPPLAAGVLPGTVRATILEQLAPRCGQPAAERPLSLDDLGRADEAFLTSALLDVMPITVIDAHPVGSGTPGPVTSMLLAAARDPSF